MRSKRVHRGVLCAVCCAAGVLVLGPAEARAAPPRPDLAITSIKTNRVSVVGRPFYVIATVIERSRRAAARARITVTANSLPLTSTTIAVRPGQRLVVKLPVTLPAPGKTSLVTAVTGTKPVEAVISNNIRRATVNVAEFRARWSSVVVPDFGGYGGQFNHHVYSALSRAVGVNDTNVLVMEQKMRALHPQFSRIFFTPQAFADPDKMQSFVRTVLFAQSTGTTINITWQGGTLSVAAGTVQKFANVLLDLVRNRGVTNLRWLTLQNEPNRTRMTLQQYETQYRELDPYIQSIRGQVRYMGGDLVRGPDASAPNQAAWFQYMATRMYDILDAYSVHIFWDYWDTQKLVLRLKEVRAIVNAMPQQARKPIYVTEYGVRGQRVFDGAPQVDPGVWDDGSAIGQTNVSAFQQAWFDVLAANLGYVATSKWDSYFGRYDNGSQAYYFIGDPQNGWPLYPLYNLVQLLTTTVKREWRVAAVDSVSATSRLLGAYLGKNGQQTIIGLDTTGAQLNTVSPTLVSYTIAGLPPSKTLQLAVWNQAGDGLVAPARLVATDAAGVAKITVPQQAVFVLTTLRLPST